MNVNSSLTATLAPQGWLRAAINFGNPILASRDEYGRACGVSVDLATELAGRLGVALELVVVDAARKSVDLVAQDQADVGFFAVDPSRAAKIHFTAPYVLIEGYFLVRDSSAIWTNAHVDAPGNCVAVCKGSVYDLYLTRELKEAHILRAPTSLTVVQTLLERNLEAVAAVRQQLEVDASRKPGLRLLDKPFMAVRQAMGLPRSRGAVAAARLNAFVEEMKVSGFVQQALERHGIAGASVAAAQAYR